MKFAETVKKICRGMQVFPKAKGGLFALWLCAAAAGNLILKTYDNDFTARIAALDDLTASEYLRKGAYMFAEAPYLDKHRSIEEHRERLLEHLDEGFDSYRQGIWDYIQYWYLTRTDSSKEDSDCMWPYADIVRGIPGGSAEGAVIYYAHLKRLDMIPETGEKLRHSLLFVDYNSVDEDSILIKVLYVGEIEGHDGDKRYFGGGIYPFENPNREFSSIESLILENMKKQRIELWKKGVDEVIFPAHYCMIDPEEIMADVVWSSGLISADDARSSAHKAEAKQMKLKFMRYFYDNMIGMNNER